MSTILGANPLGFIKNENSLLSIDSVILSEESSYVSQTLKFIQESNREFDEANKGWYKAILESGNDQEVITESFHDFFVKVKDIIDKFIAFIKSLAERFITNIMSIGKSDNYLKKHKDDLKKFTSKDEFDFDGYEFTFNPAVPICDVQAEFTPDFVGITAASDASINTAEEFAAAMKKLYNDLVARLENNYYDEFRKTVLAVTHDISQSDFYNECFSVFRNNSSDKETLTINSAYVVAAYGRFTNYSDMKKEAESIKKRLTKEYEAVKKQILNISKVSYTGGKVSDAVDTPNGQIAAVKFNSDGIKYLDLYVKAKSDQVQEMSNIHAIAFSSKLDAMKASFVQDKTILYKALSKCQRVHTEANYTDYTKQLEYATFLMESIENQTAMERYVEECCIISEGVDVFNRIRALNEGKISEKFKKFVDWIKGLIAKFIEKLNGLFAKDKTYLEKYKNIILGKKFKDETYNMPEYFNGLKRINSIVMPQLNYKSQETLLAGENGEFAKSIIKEYDPSKFDSFSEFCKSYFQGSADSRDFNGSEVGTNIKDMYDFCYDYTKIKNKINSDQNTLLRAAKTAEDILTNASKENEANRAAASTTPQNASYIYSAVYDKFVTEVEIKSDDKQPETANTDTASGGSKKMSDNIANIQDKDNKVDNDNDETKAIAAKQDVEKITNNIKRYTDTCSSLLTAKLTIIEKIRSDFMKIIRHHVQNYVGKANDAGDNRGANAQGSDYRNLSDEDKKKVDQAFEQYNSADTDEKKNNVVENISKATGKSTGWIRNIFKKKSQEKNN